MPPKTKKEAESVSEPSIEDPAVAAARAERERVQGEERKVFERNETIDRRRVEAMEQVGAKLIQFEKEKRLDPAGWAAKTTYKGPKFVRVKLLVGNRGIPQEILEVPIVEGDTTVLLLKNGIRDAAVKLGHLAETYDPQHQRLFFQTKEVSVPDEYNCSLASLGIFVGSSLQVSLNIPTAMPSHLR
jgi:hypothetical protein